MKCVKCGVEYSDSVCRIHVQTCEPIKKETKKSNIIEEKELSKRDLMLKILSEKDGYKEDDLIKLKKDELLDIINGKIKEPKKGYFNR